jgi:hypothetical protein
VWLSSECVAWVSVTGPAASPNAVTATPPDGSAPAMIVLMVRCPDMASRLFLDTLMLTISIHLTPLRS